jgi:hypothetical protein
VCVCQNLKCRRFPICFTDLLDLHLGSLIVLVPTILRGAIREAEGGPPRLPFAFVLPVQFRMASHLRSMLSEATLTSLSSLRVVPRISKPRRYGYTTYACTGRSQCSIVVEVNGRMGTGGDGYSEADAMAVRGFRSDVARHGEIFLSGKIQQYLQICHGYRPCT